MRRKQGQGDVSRVSRSEAGTPRYVPSTHHFIPRKMAYLTNAFFLFQQGIEGTPPDVPASRRDMQETSPCPLQRRSSGSESNRAKLAPYGAGEVRPHNTSSHLTEDGLICQALFPYFSKVLWGRLLMSLNGTCRKRPRAPFRRAGSHFC